MIILKDGVNVTGVKTEIILAINVAHSIWKDLGYDLVVTSLNDGVHGKTSLHYALSAVDFRTRNMKKEEAEKAERLLNESLGIDYDVILEDNPPHMHCEHQPRRR